MHWVKGFSSARRWVSYFCISSYLLPCSLILSNCWNASRVTKRILCPHAIALHQRSRHTVQVRNSEFPASAEKSLLAYLPPRDIGKTATWTKGKERPYMHQRASCQTQPDRHCNAFLIMLQRPAFILSSHSVENHERRRLSEVTQLLIVKTLQVLLLDELVDHLLDIGRFRLEAGCELRQGFLHEQDMLQLLAGLHDTDDGRLFGNLLAIVHIWIWRVGK